jgi:hypothetical protein
VANIPRPRRRKVKTPFQPDLNCTSKRQFKTEAAAKEAAEFGMLQHMTVELDVYHCPNCNFWHLTRQKKD